MIIRKADAADVLHAAAIYDAIHTEEEAGRAEIGWVRGVYPTLKTAQAAYERGDLFVQEADGRIVGAAIINQCQCDGYETAAWQYPAADSDVMVLHTLVVLPEASGRGLGRAFVAFYEDYARKQGCRYLRMDTNARNARARAMYASLGYREIGIVPTVFNGISGVNLVLLEKRLPDSETPRMNPEMDAALTERFGRDSLIALATVSGGIAHVRTVDACYAGGAFYIVTHAASNKMKHIGMQPIVGLCGEWFTGHGTAENMGHVLREENSGVMQMLRNAFAAWYSNGHVHEDDPGTILLRVTLTDGVLMKDGKRLEMA